MQGRLAMAAFIAAVAGVQTLPVLPGSVARTMLAGVCVLAFALYWRLGASVRSRHLQDMRATQHTRPPKPTNAPRGSETLRAAALCVCVAGVGALYAMERAQLRLEDVLPAEQENQVVRATFRVASLTQLAPDAVRFDAEVVDAQGAGLPRHIRVSWPLPVRGDAAVQRSIMPGQRWQAALVLKRPHSLQNPYASDGEARLFQRKVRASATVRGRPRLLEDDGWRFGMAAVNRVRHVLRERMLAALDGARYGPVIVALALGDQAGVPREDWRVFNATGITHLVSISGLHVTLIAGLAGTAVAWCWRRLRWRGLPLAEALPAQLAGIAAALCVAWLYCLLAGWGIPARRTFLTLAVAGTTALVRLPLSNSGTLLLAACVVVALDPWAPIAPGFWLSFGAVAAVLAWGHATRERADAEQARWRAWLRGCMHAGRLQCVVTFGLVPVLAFLTQQVPLASPVANALAIPAVSFVVTPLALLCAALCAVPGAEPVAAWAGHAGQWIFGAVMRWIGWLAGHDWAVLEVAAPPPAVLMVAMGGIAWALLPPAMASRRWAWLLILPALCWRPSRPADGDWRLTALDVGQGGAVVVETARRTVVFDAGPLHRNGTDAAQRVLWPYLRARGVKRIDTLVLSHGDQDHAGGLDSLLRAVPVDVAYASFDVHARVRRDARLLGQASEAPAPAVSRRCQAGQAWQVDGVRFIFLHPSTASPNAPRRYSKDQKNAAGCVLLVQGRHHAALLPGDVGVGQERLFADSLPRVDVVIAPHHGSATSSGAMLVEAAQPAHVVAQVGYLNRFRHPAAAVQRRWRRGGAAFWRTDHHGAIIARSAADGLSVHARRESGRRYWHTAPNRASP
jgi:competence protein ComEC